MANINKLAKLDLKDSILKMIACFLDSKIITIQDLKKSIEQYKDIWNI